MKVNFDKALSLLQSGGVVAIPTETVYGLAGRIDSEKALKKIFQLKKRPAFNPLIVHCHNKSQALAHSLQKHALLEKLWDRFSPGPLSLIVQKSPKISSLITGGRDTVAIRIPKTSLTRKLIQKLGVPLAAPSANPYGKVSPVRAEHVLSFFKNRVPVLDGGPCQKALESTILSIDFKNQVLRIVRPGILTKRQIENFLIQEGLSFKVSYHKELFWPGASVSHYKPLVPFYIVQSEKSPLEIKKYLSKKYPKRRVKELKLLRSAQKSARQLYLQLIKFSKDKKNLIYVQKKSEPKDTQVPNSDNRKDMGTLWITIWDRLEKAASKSLRI